MAAQNIIPQQEAAGEADFTVVTGTHIKCAGGDGAQTVAVIHNVNSDGTTSPLMTQFESGTGPVPAVLSGIRSSIHITAPGDYRVIKSQTDYPVGVDKSE